MIKNPPTAKKIPHQLEKHGDIRVDNYFWMNDRDDPEVIDYLKCLFCVYKSGNLSLSQIL